MIVLRDEGIGRDATKVLYLTPSANGQSCWEMRELSYDHHTIKLDDLDPQEGRFIAAGSLQSLLGMFLHELSLKIPDPHERIISLENFMVEMQLLMQQARQTINVKRYFVHDSAPNNAFPVDENDMATFANDAEFANCHEVAGPELPLVHR